LPLIVCRLPEHGLLLEPSGSALPHLFTRQAHPDHLGLRRGQSARQLVGQLDRRGATRRPRSSQRARDEPRRRRRSCVGEPPPAADRLRAHLLITDPPYYDAIPYADLSDFFYVWLRRMVGDDHPRAVQHSAVTRDEECIVNRVAGKDSTYYRRVMTESLAEARRVTRPDGVGVVIFAHKSTSGWEDLLAAMIEAGWIITASWPIDTENAGAAARAEFGSARLLRSTSCAAHESTRDGRLIVDTVGDWREVLAALPGRIHAWMPRLAHEGIVGADALFACLGPALELFSRFARVEKVSGEVVTLSEYLVHVWGAVSREALSMIFEDADTTGLEADARVTAMWLWTLAGGRGESADTDATDEPLLADTDEIDDPSGRYALEFDAARKIAQGLGARLEELGTLVAVKGGTASLLSVTDRRDALLGTAARTPTSGRAVKRGRQAGLFEAVTGELAALGGKPPEPGRTTLDRLHQAMLLFGAGQPEVLKRFLVECAVGEQPNFWRLAQALSTLYPLGSDENRWVDGVLARKKGLGFG
jgi:putative DNA methylase